MNSIESTPKMGESHNVVCPHCASEVAVFQEDNGGLLKCFSCNGTFSETGALSSDKLLPEKVFCPKCNKRLSLTLEERKAQAFTCKHCNEEFSVDDTEGSPGQRRAYWVMVMPREDRIDFPRECPCCGSHADAASPYRVAWTSKGTKYTHKGSVPLCWTCLEHQKAATTEHPAVMLALFVAIISLTLAFVVTDPFAKLIAVLGTILSFAAAVVVAAVLKRNGRRKEPALRPTCSSRTCFSVRKASAGSLLFGFANSRYAERLAELNDGRLLKNYEVRKFRLTRQLD